MPVPKKRTSKSRRNMRRAHDGLKLSSALVCPNCLEYYLPHRVCSHCGYYKGQRVMAVGMKAGNIKNL